MDVSTDHIYEGKVIGDRNSYVFGSLLNGVFEGKIITERDAYYVEHAKRYFPHNFTKTTSHHSEMMISNTTTEQTTTTRRIMTSPTSSTRPSQPLTEDDLIRNVGFHSVIYKDSHVDDVYEHVREEGKSV